MKGSRKSGGSRGPRGFAKSISRPSSSRSGGSVRSSPRSWGGGSGFLSRDRGRSWTRSDRDRYGDDDRGDGYYGGGGGTPAWAWIVLIAIMLLFLYAIS